MNDAHKPAYGPDVRRIRRRMRLTQARFAAMFGFSVATLRHWERGNRQPRGASLALLFVIDDNPRAVREAIRRARIKHPGCLAPMEAPRSNRLPPGFGQRRPPLWPRRRFERDLGVEADW